MPGPSGNGLQELSQEQSRERKRRGGEEIRRNRERLESSLEKSVLSASLSRPLADKDNTHFRLSRTVSFLHIQ